MTNFVMNKKNEFSKIKISDINIEKPDLKSSSQTKVAIIADWLSGWIEDALDKNLIKTNSLLPSKNEFAYFLGVSVGTIQNVLRNLEDNGIVESKQRIGTIVRDRNSSNSLLRKLTSKREIVVLEIKKFIINNKIKVGESLPSSRALSTLINCSINTTRLAMDYLCSIGIIEHSGEKSSEAGWIVKSTKFNKNFKNEITEQTTLVEKVELDIKDYIDQNLNIGDKIPSHQELSAIFNVSIKTIHDALKALIKDEILLARRGRYGTTVINLPKNSRLEQQPEKSIFAPAKDTAFYYYEKTQNAIKSMIADNYEIGSKLPSILELSKAMDLSPNTIRKAFHNLAKEGYLTFSRGRYGGTFVLDIPQTGEETFKWLAVNPKYAEIYSN